MWLFTAKYIDASGTSKWMQCQTFDSKEQAEECAKSFIDNAYSETDPYALKNLTDQNGHLRAHSIIIGQSDGNTVQVKIKEEKTISENAARKLQFPVF